MISDMLGLWTTVRSSMNRNMLLSIALRKSTKASHACGHNPANRHAALRRDDPEANYAVYCRLYIKNEWLEQS